MCSSGTVSTWLSPGPSSASINHICPFRSSHNRANSSRHEKDQLSPDRRKKKHSIFDSLYPVPMSVSHLFSPRFIPPAARHAAEEPSVEEPGARSSGEEEPGARSSGEEEHAELPARPHIEILMPQHQQL
jgi:hypothetical protein